MNTNKENNSKAPHYTLAVSNHPSSLVIGEYEGGAPLQSLEDDDMEDLVSKEILITADNFESYRDLEFN